MITPLAARNLGHEKLRTVVAAAGVAFAVILILMQLGFLWSVVRTATLVYEQLDFDIALLSNNYLHLGKAGLIPRERLEQAAGQAEVVAVAPLTVTFQLWLNPSPGSTQRRSMMLLAIDPARPLFLTDEVRKQQPLLTRRDTLLVDRLSRKEFGAEETGIKTELGSVTVEVAGHYTMGTGFAADGGALASQATLRDVAPFLPPGQISLGLVKLTDEADANVVADHLRAALPPDTQVLTHDQLNAHEQHHWVVKTSVGIIFGLGVVVAMIVGLGVVYQVLSSDIAKRMNEYATLSAMGYRPRFLSTVVLQQAAILAVVGYIPGWIVSYALFQIAAAEARIPMRMTWPLAAGVFALCMVMCLASGWLALRKLRTVDPAELFA